MEVGCGLEHMLRSSIGASNYIGTHVEEYWAQEDMWHIARGGPPCMRTLGQ